jgi:flagellar biosynthesis/type III secretory pathway protein FliH
MRREAEIMRKLDRAEDLAEGREQGLAEGRQQGLAEGRQQGLAEGEARARIAKQRANIEALCRAFGIELNDERRAELYTLDEAALDARLQELAQLRTWR